MSTVQGGSQITNGKILLSIDFGTRNSYAPNLLNHSNWIAGSGSISADASLSGCSGYSSNASVVEETIREYGTDPYGNSTIIWTSPSNDLSANNDGGWNTSSFDIDSKKMYRFSVWIKRTGFLLGASTGGPSQSTPARGYVYLGMVGRSVTNTTVPVGLRVNGTTTSNPYFYVSESLLCPPQSNAGEWTLLVGHVWPEGSGTGSNHPDTGAWTVSGGQTYSLQATQSTLVDNRFRDFVWTSSAKKSVHRTYLWYSTDVSERVEWAYPRVDIIDGREPSIAELLVGPDIIRDLSKESKTMVPTLANSSNWRSNKVGSFGFSGTMSFLDPTTTALGASNSIDIWFKRRASINSLNILFSRQLPYFAFRSDGKFIYSNRINLSQTSVSSSATYSNGVWYNATCTTDYASAINVSTMRIYVDGGLEGSGTFSGIQTNYGTSMDRIMIGAHLNGLMTDSQYYYHFDGDIGEVRVYDRSLTAEEILAGYNKRKSRYK
jgi:hypothetical protein